MKSTIATIATFLIILGCSDPASREASANNEETSLPKKDELDSDSLGFLDALQSKPMEGNSTCRCDDGDLIYKIPSRDNLGFDLIVCGYKLSEMGSASILISALLVYDCVSKKAIIDFSGDEISQSLIKIYDGDSISLVQNQYAIIDSNWNIGSVPFAESVIKFENGRAVLTNPKVVFSPHIPTKLQADSIIKLCQYLDEFKEVPSPAYPLNEKSIYILYMGHTAGIECSTALLGQLNSIFKLDGAVAETLRELPL